MNFSRAIHFKRNSFLGFLWQGPIWNCLNRVTNGIGLLMHAPMELDALAEGLAKRFLRKSFSRTGQDVHFQGNRHESVLIQDHDWEGKKEIGVCMNLVLNVLDQIGFL